MKTCSFCNPIYPRLDRSRVSGLRAETYGDLILLDHGSKIGDTNFGFPIILDKAICEDMAFHHLHDMQAFYRMHNVKRIPT